MAPAGIDIAGFGQRGQFTHPVSRLFGEKADRNRVDIRHEDFSTEAPTNLVQLVELRLPVDRRRAVELAQLVGSRSPEDVAEQPKHYHRHENAEEILRPGGSQLPR